MELAIQKWLPKSQIGWEYVPTVPIFLEPWPKARLTLVECFPAEQKCVRWSFPCLFCSTQATRVGMKLL